MNRCYLLYLYLYGLTMKTNKNVIPSEQFQYLIGKSQKQNRYYYRGKNRYYYRGKIDTTTEAKSILLQRQNRYYYRGKIDITTEAKSIPLTHIPLTLPILAIRFRPFGFIVPKTLNQLVFQSFDFEPTCARNLISTFLLLQELHYKWRF